MRPEYFWWGGMWMMWLFPLVIFGIILLLVYLIFGKGGFRSSRQEFETPLDILKRRYAEGEITKEQYTQMRQDIS